ncbi:hypothetical protein LshimejAT787_0900790 [Lyophyllum shimeji]|uniref:Uncharacterized protein n=1 Tax=Lyophyllum shimeji TaxID=47721 RepID=A0A9P3PSP2_LYOSH|nr:hypothetical protein LshimejAT787_0900790 [Lyophyllum shimeji]
MMLLKYTFLALSAIIPAANAYTGRASWDSLGTTPCPQTCGTPTDFRVALPVTLFPNGEKCCSQVLVQYQGKRVAVTFTDLFLAGANSFNISLSHQAFAELAPLEVGTISPVSWNFE